MCCEFCVLFGFHGGFLIFEVGVHSVQQGFQISSVVVVDAVKDSVEQPLVLFVNLVVLQHNKYIDITEIINLLTITVTYMQLMSFFHESCFNERNV